MSLTKIIGAAILATGIGATTLTYEPKEVTEIKVQPEIPVQYINFTEEETQMYIELNPTEQQGLYGNNANVEMIDFPAMHFIAYKK